MRGCSSAVAVDVSTEQTAIALGALDGELWTRAIPPECDLSTLTLEISDAPSAGDWTFYLSHDEPGILPITDFASSGATRTASTPLDVGSYTIVSWDLNGIAFVKRPGYGLYVQVWQTEAGGMVRPVLTWRGDP